MARFEVINDHTFKFSTDFKRDEWPSDLVVPDRDLYSDIFPELYHETYPGFGPRGYNRPCAFHTLKVGEIAGEIAGSWGLIYRLQISRIGMGGFLGEVDAPNYDDRGYYLSTSFDELVQIVYRAFLSQVFLFSPKENVGFVPLPGELQYSIDNEEYLRKFERDIGNSFDRLSLTFEWERRTSNPDFL